MTRNPIPSIPPGTKVLVHHIPLARRPFVEGSGRIIALISGDPDVYRVRFDGERIDRVRFILGGPFQDQSELCISALQAQWVANLRHAQHLQAPLRSDEGGR